MSADLFQERFYSLATSLVLSRVDYGNATLAGLPARQLYPPRCCSDSIQCPEVRSCDCSENSTGFGFRSGSFSSWRPSSSGILTAQHQCTSPTASIVRLTSARDGVCVPARQRRLLFQHDRGTRFPRRRCPRMEQFTVVCHVIVVTVDFQATFEDVHVCDLVLMALPLLFLSLSTEHVVVFTARCTLVQSAVLRSHVVCLSVCPSVCPSVRL